MPRGSSPRSQVEYDGLERAVAAIDVGESEVNGIAEFAERIGEGNALEIVSTRHLAGEGRDDRARKHRITADEKRLQARPPEMAVSGALPPL